MTWDDTKATTGTLTAAEWNAHVTDQNLRAKISPYSYLIYIDGSTIKARNGTTGAIDYSGTDAATVIQNAITKLNDDGVGGLIFIKSGTYIINSVLQPGNNIIIEGEGTVGIAGTGTTETNPYATKLYRGNNVHDALFNSWVEGKCACVFRNITFIGNSANNWYDRGCFEGWYKFSLWENCLIKDFAYGIKLSDNEGVKNIISKNIFYDMSISAIYCESMSTDSSIDNNFICNEHVTGDKAIDLKGGGWIISNNHIYKNFDYGVYINYKGNRNTISGNIIETIKYTHIYLKSDDAAYEGCVNNNIINNQLWLNSVLMTDNTTSGIVIEGTATKSADGNIIIGNSFNWNTHTLKYCVEEKVLANYNIIKDNIMLGSYGTSGVLKLGANTIVCNNIGYKTENRGSAASIADGGTIDHGLVASPTTARVSGSVAGEMVSVTTLDATHITVAIKKHDGSAGTTQTIYWDADV